MKHHLFVFFCLATIIALIYSNSFHASFHLDDHNIINNPNLHPKNLTVSEVKKGFYAHPTIENILYRPVASLTFALNYYIGRLEVFGYHVVNVSIHFITAFFLYLLIGLTLRLPFLKERYGKDAYHIAFLTGALWATHPVQTQAVTYIIQRMTSMAAMFYVMSLYFYAKGRLGVGSKKPFYFAICSISAILAFYSKENTATLLPIIIIYEVFFFQKIDWKRCIKSIRSYLPPLIVLTILELFWLVSHINITGLEISYGHRDFSLWERVFTQLRVIIHYLTLLIYPSSNRLNLDYDFPVSHSLFDPPTTFLSMMVIIGLITWSLYVAKKKPLISFCILWFFINLVIESSIIALEMVFEHRLYLPSMGFFVLVATAFIKAMDYLQFKQKARYILAMALCVLLLLQAMGTYTRNFVWRDELTLWTDCARKSPRKPRVHQHLGLAYCQIKRYDLAVNEFQTVIKLGPRDLEHAVKAYNALGLVYGEKEQFEAAMKQFQKAISLDHNNAITHYNLADLYRKFGLYDRAIEEYVRVIRLNPGLADAYYNLACLYQELKRYDEAVEEYLKAIRADSDKLEAYNNLGFIYNHKGLYQEAIGWLKRGMEIDPCYIRFYGNLGIAYKNLGMQEEAVNILTKAREIDPKNVILRLRLAMGLKELGQNKGAIKELEEILGIKPNWAKAHYELARLYYQEEEYGIAKKQFQRALKINPDLKEDSDYIDSLNSNTSAREKGPDWEFYRNIL